MRRTDLIAGIALALAGLAVLFVAIPTTTRTGSWTGLSPYFFPTLAMLGFTLCAGLLVLQALFRPRLYEEQPTPLHLVEVRNFGLAALLVVAAVVIIDAAGLLVGGPLLIAALMLFMGERRWLRILLVSVLPVAVAYVFVLHVLQAPVP